MAVGEATVEENHWVRNLFRPLVVAGMMTCVAVSVVGLVRLFVPAWDATYLLVAVFLISLEAITSNRLIRHHSLRGGNLLRFRAAEWVVILLALKLLSYLPQGLDQLLADLALWRQDFSFFVTPEYIVAGLLALFAWDGATFVGRDLDLLGMPPEYGPLDRQAILGRLMGRFFWGGILLLICSGLARLGLAAILALDHPPVPGIILNALVYFVLGLLLLSQARLSVLQTSWQLQQIEAAPTIATRWAWYGLSFITLVACLALLLPTGYSVGLLETLGAILSLILDTLLFILMLLQLLLMLILGGLARLLFDTALPLPQPPSQTAPLPREPISPMGGPSLLELIRSLLFWALVLGIVGYSLRNYIQYRRGLFAPLLGSRPWRALRALLRALWQRLRGVAEAVAEPLARRLARPGLSVPRGDRRLIPPFLLLSSLAPRELVQYFYLSIVKRAARLGQPRQIYQTPYEYTASLGAHLPEAVPDLATLTQAFVEARYSRHPVTKEEANLVKRHWQRVKAALRRAQGG
ncbi:MAG: DUF4129 domain-containing protein [Anaerolineae bacterium]